MVSGAAWPAPSSNTCKTVIHAGASCVYALFIYALFILSAVERGFAAMPLPVLGTLPAPTYDPSVLTCPAPCLNYQPVKPRLSSLLHVLRLDSDPAHTTHIPPAQPDAGQRESDTRRHRSYLARATDHAQREATCSGLVRPCRRSGGFGSSAKSCSSWRPTTQACGPKHGSWPLPGTTAIQRAIRIAIPSAGTSLNARQLQTMPQISGREAWQTFRQSTKKQPESTVQQAMPPRTPVTWARSL